MKVGAFMSVALSVLVLAACARDKPTNVAPAATPTASDPQANVPAPAEPTSTAGARTKEPGADGPATVRNDVLAGWYMERGTIGSLQLCGQDKQLGVDSAELRAEAKAFGLDANTPVYVRVTGKSDGSTVTVTRVEQFGSPTLVRDCGMTGVVTPASGG